MSEKTTHFGFETVPEAEKAGRVQGVFGSVASKYDVMNDAMSLGQYNTGDRYPPGEYRVPDPLTGD